MAFDAVDEGQVGAGVARFGVVEFGAERSEGLAAAWCGGGVEPDVQFGADDPQVANKVKASRSSARPSRSLRL